MDQTAPQSRGEDTKAQLLETGLRLFAEHGFEAVSTRQLAREAGANIAAINYHFGGKRELYRAVLTQLVADTDPFFKPAFEMIGARLDAADGDKAKIAGLVRMLASGLFSAMISDEFMRWRAPLVMREFAMPSGDFGILYEGRLEPLHKLMSRIVADTMGGAPEDQGNIIRAHAALGQIVVFVIGRVILWTRLGWDGYSSEDLDAIQEPAIEMMLRALDLPAGPPEQSKGTE